MKMALIILVVALTAGYAQARQNQQIDCLGVNQQGTLTITDKGVSVKMIELDQLGREDYKAENMTMKENLRNRTITYSNKAKRMSVTIPKSWLGKTFSRLHKNDARGGYKIVEETAFKYNERGSLSISECSSFMY